MTEDKILTARISAQFIAERMTGAFWARDHRRYLTMACADDLRKLANAFGFDLVARDEPAAALIETIPHEVTQ